MRQRRKQTRLRSRWPTPLRRWREIPTSSSLDGTTPRRTLPRSPTLRATSTSSPSQPCGGTVSARRSTTPRTSNRPLPATNTVTVTFNAATPYVDLRALEYSGLDLANPFDVGASASGTSTSANSGAVTTTAARRTDLRCRNDNRRVQRRQEVALPRASSPRPTLDIAEDRFVTATGSYSATASLGGSAAWVMQVATFKAAS